MIFSYDESKNKTNLAKHSVALSDAELLEWDSLICTSDARRDYGEFRFIGFELIGERLYCVVFTMRGETHHIISLRKANNREKENYAHHY